MIINNQITLGDINPEYQAFIDKFKPKKTTDDCYTPSNVYEAVLSWVVKEYEIDRAAVVRPFWPGADFERYDYPENCVVVDNPPFSIISKIVGAYCRAGIKFFLFAPYLTNFSTQCESITHIITNSDIMYENGASINTSFITNLDTCEVRTACDLREAINEADTQNRRELKRELPKYRYPDNVVTASMIGYMCKSGIDFKLEHSDCLFIRFLDNQKEQGKAIFGSGYLISEKAAAEKAAAEKAAAEKAAAEKAAAEKAAAIVWKLSDREKQIIESLG